MRLLDLIEDYQELPVSDLISPNNMVQLYQDWSDYLGDDDRGLEWVETYVDMVNGLHNRGGYIFRLLFLHSPDDLQTDDFGAHWTVDESQIDYFSDGLRQMGDPNYSKTAYLLTVKIKPKSITVPIGTVVGEPTEWEVNLTNQSAIIDYKLTEH